MKAMLRMAGSAGLLFLAYGFAVPPHMSRDGDIPRWYIGASLAAGSMLLSRILWPAEHERTWWRHLFEATAFAGFIAVLFLRVFR